jgi:hypothetical protein
VKRAAVVLVVLGFLAACGGPRSGLGTDASACFRAIPAARDAVHDRGSLVGVRIVGDQHAREIVPHQASSDERHRVCLVAFRGDFGPDSVEQTVRYDGSDFAVVAVRLDAHPTELGALVTNKLPARFRHL